MSIEPGDSASVVIEKAGHYCIAFVEGAGALLPIMYDSNKVFGTSMNLQDARGLLGSSVADLVAGKQHGNAWLPLGVAVGPPATPTHRI